MMNAKATARNLLDRVFIFIDLFLSCSQVRCRERPFWIQKFAVFNQIYEIPTGLQEIRADLQFSLRLCVSAAIFSERPTRRLLSSP
jgi:hypothetical protein